MKQIVAIILLLGTLATFAQTQIPAKDRMVIVISLDGFPGFALEDPKQPIPTLQRLMRDGTSARMHMVNPTITWPNHKRKTGLVGSEWKVRKRMRNKLG